MSKLSDAVDPLLHWYQKERRILPWREDPTPYHVWLSEIMLQQTRVDTVIPFYQRFLNRFPDIPTLAAADLDEVLVYWQGLGYYRRCRALHEGARIVVEKYRSELPSEQKALMSLPGIGRYTSAAILSIGFGLPYPAVDGNVLRVIMRLLNRGDCIDLSSVRNQVEEELKAVMPINEASAFTQALMDLGATVCLPNGAPRCDRCPWHHLCEGKDRYEELPVRKEKNPRRVEERTVFLFCCKDRFAVRKRPENGLLAGMWEFPNLEGFLSEEEIAARYRGSISPIAKGKHIFTHIEWHLLAYRVETEDYPENEDWLWLSKEELDDYAIPTAFAIVKNKI